MSSSEKTEYKLENLTKCAETQNANKQLKALYDTWFEVIRKSEEDSNICFRDRLTIPMLLTCMDPYLSKEFNGGKRIMLFGREAHITDTSVNKNFWSFISGTNNTYQTDDFYNYDKEIIEGRANATNFLKTRMLLCDGVKYVKADKLNNTYDKKTMSVIVNNINKVSVNGEKTPCSENLEFLYRPFQFEGITANIFIHEIRILRPTHIVLACGTGAHQHINRAFDENYKNTKESFYKKLLAGQEAPKLISPINEPVTFSAKSINSTAFANDDYKIEFVMCVHPLARLKKELRNKYNDVLEKLGTEGYHSA